MKPFFIKIRFGLGQTIWADKFWGIWGIFGQFISTHFCNVSPLSMFSINQPCIEIPNIYLGLGFEFELWQKKIWDLDIACL